LEWVRQKNLRESAKSADQLRLRISSFPIPRLSAEQATDKIDIRKDASITGDIKAARIETEDGAYLKGSVDTQGRQVSHPSSEKKHS